MSTIETSPRTLKGLMRDAARYRFLRKRMTSDAKVGIWKEASGRPVDDGWLVFRECDNAVDADMIRETKNK